jgi:RND family efflux transporter MFP subunit
MKRRHSAWLVPALISLALATGCRESKVVAVPAKETPAKVTNGGLKEADLATITLSAEAERRLGIETVAAEERAGGRTATWAGEIVIPPGQTLAVAAPVAGAVAFAGQGAPPVGGSVRRGSVLVELSPLLAAERDLRVSMEGEVSAAQTRVDAAKLRFERAERLLKDQVGSAKAREAAQEDLALAQTVLSTARAKLDRLNRTPLEADTKISIASPQDGILKAIHVATGQKVAAGAPLFEVERLDSVWVRVPVYAGDLSTLVPDSAATVRPLNAGPGAPSREAAPVSAPPSADAGAATVDLYFALANSDLSLRPGQKVSVTLPLRGEGRALTIPWAAVLYDIHGGAWVYERTAPQKFTRRRVEIARVTGGQAALARGLRAGAQVVTAGAAELFGTEFSTGK